MQGKTKITKEDKAWSIDIKETCGNACMICGATEKLNAHHLIPREIKEFKHDLENGISLCPSHHRFSFKLSAHQNPIAFLMWFKDNHPLWYNKIINKINSLE